MSIIRTHDGKWYDEATGEMFDADPREPDPVDEAKAAEGEQREAARREAAAPAPSAPEQPEPAPQQALTVTASPAISGTLTLADGRTLDLATISSLAAALVASGYWSDARKVSQAIAKLVLGTELGLSPVAAMSSIHVVDGKPILGAHALAALVTRRNRVRYRIEESTDRVCRIRWEERDPASGTWEAIGESSYTWEEAERAGLAGKKNWKTSPVDMLYARAMGRGARRFAPSEIGGSVYVEGEISDAEIVEVHP